MQLKYLNSSTTELVQSVFKDILSSHSDLLRQMGAFEAVTFLRSCDLSINHDLTRSITYICDHGKQQYTLVDMHKIVKSLIEINQEFLSECKEEWSHTELLPLVYDYYQIIRGTSVLYIEFLRLLKDASDSWLSVKLALEQIVAKSRTYNYYSYTEMLEQLNDLEAAGGIKFCDNFIRSFAFICKQTVSFSRDFSEHIQDIEKFKSMVTLEKVSSITVVVIFSILTTYMCTDKQLQEIKGASSYSMWLDLIHGWSDKWFPTTGSYGRELRIWDFIDSAVVVRDLKTKMAPFACFTRDSEEEMMIATNKLEKMTDKILVTIEDMNRHAHQYSLDIREAGITLNKLIADGNLQLGVTGVRLMAPNEEQNYENSGSQAMTTTYRATLSLIPTDLQWYVRACEEDEEADGSSLLSCHSIIHDNSNSIGKIICDHPRTKGVKSLDDIHKAITRLHTINQEAFTVLNECKEEWRQHPQLIHLVYDYHKICLQASQLYKGFVRWLHGQCDSLLSVIFTLEEFVVNARQDDNDHWIYVEEMMMMHHNDDGRFMLAGDFIKSLVDICKQTVAFARQFDEEIQELKSVKVLAKVSGRLIAGVLSLMATSMEEKTLTCVWLHLIRCFSWNSLSPLWKGERLVIKDFFDIDSLLSKVKCILGKFCYGGLWDIMVIDINTVGTKILELSVTFEEMRRHAYLYCHETIKAGRNLELNEPHSNASSH